MDHQPDHRYRSSRNYQNYQADHDPPNHLRTTEEASQARKQGSKRPETMSSWIQRQASSHHVQLAGAAVLSGAAVAGAILGYQSIKRKAAVDQLKSSIPIVDEQHLAQKLTDFGAATPANLSKEDQRSAALARRAQQGDYDDDLILEQLARNRVFLTDEGLSKLRSSFIIVVGCGGVGSHAAAALARSGVGKIRLVDFDQVTLSSLNRHAVATLADVGTPKVQCIRRRLEQIAPWVKFDCRNELFGESAANDLLAPWSMTGDESTRQPDYILDCIDNIGSKVSLLHICHSKDLPVISAMGAGCKSDPTRIVVGDISLSMEDQLSRSTRRRLKALGVTSGIPAVFSIEKPGPGKASLLPLPEDEFTKGEVGELGVLPDFRVRILPVLGTMPAVFGYTLANHVICEVSGYPNDYNPGGKGRDKVYEGILSTLQSTEHRLARVETGEELLGLKIPVNKDDVGYLVEEVWRSRSVVSGLTTRLALIRWQRPENGFRPDPELEKEGQKGVPLQFSELVCMTKEEALRHEKEILLGDKKPTDLYDETILQKVQERMREEELFAKYR